MSLYDTYCTIAVLHLVRQYGVDVGPEDEAVDKAKGVVPQCLDQLGNYQQQVVLGETTQEGYESTEWGLAMHHTH